MCEEIIREKQNTQSRRKMEKTLYSHDCNVPGLDTAIEARHITSDYPEQIYV